jgi:citrate synthase
MTAKTRPPPATAISAVAADRVTVRGFDLCRDLIGAVSLTEHFLILLTGTRPPPALVAATDAALVAIAEHGLVPSVQVARMTLSAAPEAVQGAVAAGLLGCGTVILGAAESAGRLLAEVADAAERGDGDVDAAAISALARLKADKRPLPGFGHPVHRREDPRATRLMAIAHELGVAGRHVAALRALERHVESAYGRWLPTNVSAAIPALLLDAGYPVGALKGVPLIARCAALNAHLLEEQRRPIGFRLAELAEQGTAYDGQPAKA